MIRMVDSIKNKKILIVDDETDMIIFVSTVVETIGFKPIAAHSGTDALKKSQSEIPDLIVLDVMMPKIEDGIQTYFYFRSNIKLSNIPIVILSAIAEKTFMHLIRVLSAQEGKHIPVPQAYMEKPPDATKLSTLIKSILSNNTF